MRGILLVMKRVIKVLAISFALAGMLTQSAFSFTNGKWVYIEAYEERASYNVDRGEISKYIVKLYEHISGKSAKAEENMFADINENSEPYAVKAYSLGIMEPYAEGIFSPKTALTYEEFSGDIYRLACKVKSEIAFEYAGKGEEYADLDFVVSRGIMTIDEAQKKGKVTLGEAVKILDNVKNAFPDFSVKVDTSEMDFSIEPGPKAYLTFDDGISYLTPLILDTLKEYDAKATFFIAGFGNEDVIKRMDEEGHTVAVHTYTHDYSSIYRSSEAFWEDIKIESDYLSEILGYTPTIMRFPGGSNNTVSHRYGGASLMKVLREETEEKGYIYFDWNNDSKDADGNYYTPEQIANNVLNTTRGKDTVVVLMHQTAPKVSTYKALPKIIEGLRAQGYALLPLTESSPKIQFN